MSANSNTDQNQKVVHGDEPALHNTNVLMSISGQAKFLSWIMLLFSAVSLVLAVIYNYTMFQHGYSSGLGNSIYYLLSVMPLLIGLSLYLILRFIAESILFFLDMEIDIQDFGKKNG